MTYLDALLELWFGYLYIVPLLMANLLFLPFLWMATAGGPLWPAMIVGLVWAFTLLVGFLAPVREM